MSIHIDKHGAVSATDLPPPPPPPVQPQPIVDQFKVLMLEDPTPPTKVDVK
jgi:hypothetical protein